MSSPIPSTCLKDVPVTLFKLATEELSNRYKACLAVSALVEEAAELGSALGKALTMLRLKRLAPLSPVPNPNTPPPLCL
jgi:hypothetical protein